MDCSGRNQGRMVQRSGRKSLVSSCSMQDKADAQILSGSSYPVRAKLWNTNGKRIYKRRRVFDRGPTPAEVFTPEDFTDEQRMIGDTMPRVYRQRGASESAGAGGPRLGDRPRLAEKGRRTRAAWCEHSRGIRRHGTRPDVRCR